MSLSEGVKIMVLSGSKPCQEKNNHNKIKSFSGS
jgi:hypothetical protein